ncbi:MAG TPA: flippase [Candidatus Dormibacteraeota bacterium]|nr:flippase [Candidatus Dormibacteraeota bacterium]
MSTTSASGSAARTQAGARPASRFARNVAVLAGSQVVTWTLSLAWTLFVPRAVGPSGIGELTIAWAVTGVVSTAAGVGVGTLLIKEVARDRERAPSLVGTALLARLLSIPPALLAVGLFVVVGRGGREQSTVIALAAGTMCLGLIVQVFQSALQGIERMEYLAYSDMLNKAVTLVAGIALVLIGFRAVGIMAMMLGVAAVTLMLNLWWSRGKISVDWSGGIASVSPMIVASLPYWTTGLVLAFYMWIDSVMLSLMSSDTVVGWYGVPTRVFNTLLFVPVIISTAALPRLSLAFRQGAIAWLNAARPVLEVVLVLALPVAAGTALIAQSFVSSIYGARFIESIPVLVILALTVPATYFNVIANQFLISCNRQVAWTKVMVVAAVANPAINFFLIRYFQAELHNGAIGAALSLLLTELGMAAAALYLLPPILDAESAARMLRAAAATAGMAGAVWLAGGSGFLVQGFVGASVFVGLALLLRVLSREELRLLRKTAMKVLGRDETRVYSTTKYHGWDDISARPFGR